MVNYGLVRPDEKEPGTQINLFSKMTPFKEILSVYMVI